MAGEQETEVLPRLFNQIYCMDAFALMAEIPDNYVSLILIRTTSQGGSTLCLQGMRGLTMDALQGRATVSSQITPTPTFSPGLTTIRITMNA